MKLKFFAIGSRTILLLAALALSACSAGVANAQGISAGGNPGGRRGIGIDELHHRRYGTSALLQQHPANRLPADRRGIFRTGRAVRTAINPATRSAPMG